MSLRMRETFFFLKARLCDQQILPVAAPDPHFLLLTHPPAEWSQHKVSLCSCSRDGPATSPAAPDQMRQGEKKAPANLCWAFFSSHLPSFGSAPLIGCIRAHLKLLGSTIICLETDAESLCGNMSEEPHERINFRFNEAILKGQGVRFRSV